MGVSALHRVLIVTFFTIGFFTGVLFYTLWDVVADAAKPKARGSATEMIRSGNSTYYKLQ